MTAVALELVGVERHGRRRGRAHTAGDRRDDAERVARLHRGPFPIEVPNVLVIQIDVDEAPELPFVVVKMLLQPLVLRREVAEQLADGGAVDFDDVLLAGKGPKGRGDIDLGGHGLMLTVAG